MEEVMPCYVRCFFSVFRGVLTKIFFLFFYVCFINTASCWVRVRNMLFISPFSLNEIKGKNDSFFRKLKYKKIVCKNTQSFTRAINDLNRIIWMLCEFQCETKLSENNNKFVVNVFLNLPDAKTTSKRPPPIQTKSKGINQNQIKQLAVFDLIFARLYFLINSSLCCFSWI